MNPSEKDLNFKRLLVALDASRHSESALKAAISLADMLGAELRGLFIEDPEVRRLAGTDLAQEFGLFSGARRPLDRDELERQLRGQAGKVRRYFRITTEQADIRCTYRETRGDVGDEVLSEAVDCDVVILGKGAWSAVDTGRLAPEVRQVLSRLEVSTLILQPGTRPRLPLLVLYDGSRQGDQALDLVLALAKDEEDAVVSVLLLAADAQTAAELQRQAEEVLQAGEVDTSYRRISKQSLSRLPNLVNREGYHLVVIPDLSQRGEKVMEILDGIRRPVLLIRAE